ncbi:type III secretion system stator protein SctL [Paraburkholderia sp. ZP32-5]|uniref:type III secretion system stator protein SctL n=1 Tax=Paraburkholderia sp. ZP32-5 TaxID=2883245 RepID=UPI001F48143B|nr:type III secretion system stator protein SctL [Paraburkholderia sp. ZP32-5]
MVIWLSHSREAGYDGSDRSNDSDGAGTSSRFGVHRDIVPRETFGTLVELAEAHARARSDRDALLEAARQQAARIVADAQSDAARLREAAAQEHEAAAEQGFQEGMARGLAQWLDRLAMSGNDAHRVQLRMRERMAEIVMAAVGQIVRSENVDGLFERALSVVDRIIEGATYLRVSTHPDEHAAAQRAFDLLAARWRELGRPIPLSVVPDKRLEPGSCVCESDLGIVDASISTQLRTMQSAVSRALRDSIEEEQR